jgi:hypothetical protein
MVAMGSDSRRDDIAATADSIQDDARAIDRIEAEKQTLEPSDPKADALSREVLRLADQVEKKARVERDLFARDGAPAPARKDRASSRSRSN